ncbi:MAG: c-type cytochrome [Planctomycetes bacterium]|nr:c-type cytochrome [Planctomycetota bacterium]
MKHRQRCTLPRFTITPFVVVLICLSLYQSSCSGHGPPLQADDMMSPKPVAAEVERVKRVERPSPHLTLLASADPVGQSMVARGSVFRSIGGSGDPYLVRGGELYGKYCTVCHGEQGDGDGKFAYLMNPRPRNFQQGDFKLATTRNQIPSESDLLRTISNGMPGSAMPPWGHLPQSDLLALTRYVRRFNVDATKKMLRTWVEDGTIVEAELPEVLAERTEPAAALSVPAESPFDEVRWFRGRRLYLENCASCHGVDGEPVADAVKFDAEGYPVPPRSFVSGIFKGSSEGHQLYARILKGMKGTPMPASEGVYSGDEMWDIIHYVQSLAREGAQERAQLKQGTFVAPDVRGPLPSGPSDSAWKQARALYVGLTPLWWTEQRIEGLVVQAVHNCEELAIRLSWIDPTLDNRAVRHEEFRDAVAIQFSLSSDPPFYMGDATDHGGVNIWMWKADRQQNLEDGYQDVDSVYPNLVVDRYPGQQFQEGDKSTPDWPHGTLTDHDPLFMTAWGAGNLVADPTLTTSVECLVARGPGTLSAKPSGAQWVQGSAVYERGVWSVQLQRRMLSPPPQEGDHEDERFFRPGDYLPVSFAIWNGSAGDRDGKKNISIWQKLLIE